jgi:hypothetical protein
MEALGLPVDGSLGDDDLVVSVVGMAEVMQEDGTMALMTFTSDPMSTWQALGMYQAGTYAMEMDLKEAWEGDD